MDQRIVVPVGHILCEREAEAQRPAGARLGIGRVAIAADKIERVEVPPVNLAAEQDLLVEEIRLREPRRNRLGVARPGDSGIERLAHPAKIGLLNRERNQEALEAGITGGEL